MIARLIGLLALALAPCAVTAAVVEPPLRSGIPLVVPYGGTVPAPNAYRRQPLIVPARGDFFGQIGADAFCKQITYGAAMIYRDYKDDLVLICYDKP